MKYLLKNDIKGADWGRIVSDESGETGMRDFPDCFFFGTFNDTVTEENNTVSVYYKGDKNATTIVIPYDKKTKEFGYIFEKPLDKIDLTNNEQCYQEITHFPDQYNLTSCRRYFYNNTAEHIDLTNFNITKVTDIGEMFRGCSSLTSLDVSNFNTAACTNMGAMFQDCLKLTSLDVSNFNTAACTFMGAMFRDCSSLTSLDVSNFNTAACTNMTSMFGYCYKLTSVNGTFEGTNVNLDLSSCPLTNESAMVFINGLANVSETRQITFKSTTYDTLTPEQLAVATSKGWTVIRSY